MLLEVSPILKERCKNFTPVACIIDTVFNKNKKHRNILGDIKKTLMISYDTQDEDLIVNIGSWEVTKEADGTFNKDIVNIDQCLNTLDICYKTPLKKDATFKITFKLLYGSYDFYYTLSADQVF